ncbi:hypothetical protein [Mammaliicoccus sciuri]|uniref:hypothetical protein n=1 Tax=Mammaliicoccus sciuri TaxID=1296 RepID=UPI002B25C698|nr:hypothetical protein [Mammaliicoccus sciuri]WQL17169.1 hypothetical protein P3U34_12335 [Mammaliicoccus sciuri]
MSIKNIKVVLLITIYVLFHYLYVNIIATNFNYQGFVINKVDGIDFIINGIIILFLILLNYFMKNSFYILIYNIVLLLVIYGQSIYSLYAGSNILFYYLIIPQLFLFLLDKIDKKNFKVIRKQLDINNKYFAIIVVFVSIVIMVPFIRNITSINISNLLLTNIYETRINSGLDYNIIIDYMYSSIARVFFPFLLIYFLIRKKYGVGMLILLFIILLFLLNGAVKSIIFGAVLSIFFYNFKYKVKDIVFQISLLLLSIFSLIQYWLLHSIFFADYIRRIFFLPAYLFNVYHNTFKNDYTYYSQTKIGQFLGFENNYGKITSFIGQQVLGNRDMVANVGIFVEGYISYGIIGVIISSLIFVFIVFIIKSLDFKHQFFGLIFAYLYIINTSFIETLLMTHGLLFLIIFGYFFIPTSEINLKGENKRWN